MPEKHRFPMRKYRMTRQALQADPTLRNLLEVRQVALPAQSIHTKTPCPLLFCACRLPRLSCQ